MDLSLPGKLLSLNFKQISKKELIIILGVLIGLELLIMAWQYRPIPRTHFVETFKVGKVRLVQQGDKISGRGQAGQKLTITLTPGTFQKDVQVGKSGFWLFKIPSDTGLGKYSINVSPDESTQDLTVGISSLDRTSSGVGEPTTSQSGFHRDKKTYKVRVIQRNYWSIIAGLFDRSS